MVYRSLYEEFDIIFTVGSYRFDVVSFVLSSLAVACLSGYATITTFATIFVIKIRPLIHF